MSRWNAEQDQSCDKPEERFGKSKKFQISDKINPMLWLKCSHSKDASELWKDSSEAWELEKLLKDQLKKMLRALRFSVVTCFDMYSKDLKKDSEHKKFPFKFEN